MRLVLLYIICGIGPIVYIWDMVGGTDGGGGAVGKPSCPNRMGEIAQADVCESPFLNVVTW